MTTIRMSNEVAGELLYVAPELTLNTTVRAKGNGKILSDGCLTGPTGHLIAARVLPMSKIKDAADACLKNYGKRDPAVHNPPKTEDQYYEFYYECLTGMQQDAQPLYWVDRFYNGVRGVCDQAGADPLIAREEVAAAVYLFMPATFNLDIHDCKDGRRGVRHGARRRDEVVPDRRHERLLHLIPDQPSP